MAQVHGDHLGRGARNARRCDFNPLARAFDDVGRGEDVPILLFKAPLSVQMSVELKHRLLAELTESYSRSIGGKLPSSGMRRRRTKPKYDQTNDSGCGERNFSGRQMIDHGLFLRGCSKLPTSRIERYSSNSQSALGIGASSGDAASKTNRPEKKKKKKGERGLPHGIVSRFHDRYIRWLLAGDPQRNTARKPAISAGKSPYLTEPGRKLGSSNEFKSAKRK